MTWGEQKVPGFWPIPICHVQLIQRPSQSFTYLCYMFDQPLHIWSYLCPFKSMWPYVNPLASFSMNVGSPDCSLPESKNAMACKSWPVLTSEIQSMSSSVNLHVYSSSSLRNPFANHDVGILGSLHQGLKTFVTHLTRAAVADQEFVACVHTRIAHQCPIRAPKIKRLVTLKRLSETFAFWDSQP